MECAKITHSLLGLYLAGNDCKVDIQCLLKECVITCTLRSIEYLTTEPFKNFYCYDFSNLPRGCAWTFSFGAKWHQGSPAPCSIVTLYLVTSFKNGVQMPKLMLIDLVYAAAPGYQRWPAFFKSSYF